MAETTLVLFCGQAGSGKSTRADNIAQEFGAVVLHEDDWLDTLYGDQMQSISDYAKCSAKLRAVIGAHVVNLLNAGTSVVLDFPGNTPEVRGWMREMLEKSGVPHVMHVLDVPDELRWQRLQARNAANGHPFKLTRAQFDQLARYFSVPDEAEGFHLIRHEQ